MFAGDIYFIKLKFNLDKIKKNFDFCEIVDAFVARHAIHYVKKAVGAFFQKFYKNSETAVYQKLLGSLVESAHQNPSIILKRHDPKFLEPSKMTP